MSSRSEVEAVPDASGVRIALAASREHPRLIEALLDRAQLAAAAAHADSVVMRCVAAHDLPVICQQLAPGFDAVAALGVILREDTERYEDVCRTLSAGLARVALDEHTPVGDGLLTADDEEDARTRIGTPAASSDLGYDVVLTTLGAAVAMRNIGT
jgi:6,7-dimethyl-8-ribityllumazine synthase